MKVFKRLMIVTVVILLALLASPELYYRYQLQEISPAKPGSIGSYSPDAKSALWADLEKTPTIEMESYSALSFIYSVVEAVISNDIQHVRVAVGSKVSYQVGRQMLSKKQKQFSQLKWMVMGIWVSNNFTANEALNYLLDNMYFGFGNYGLDRASNYYYGKAVSELSESEMITLIAITYSPASVNFYCGQERLMSRASRLAKNMNELWPEKYGDYTFPAPTKRTDIKCP